MFGGSSVRSEWAAVALTILGLGVAAVWADVPPPECEDPCSPGCPMEGSPCCVEPACCGQPDCNGNGARDSCDLAPEYAVSQDCNGNEIPDECDVVSGTAVGCDYEEYVYDALGRRIARIVHVPGGGQEVTHYYYDGQNVILETDGNEDPQRYYVHGPTYIDERLVMHDAVTEDEYYYFERELHSVAGLVSTNGQVAEAYRYDAYGKAHLYDGSGASIAASQVGNPYHFTGRRLDLVGDTGVAGLRPVYHYRARSYAPRHGRFLQRDPGAAVPDILALREASTQTTLPTLFRSNPLSDPRLSALYPDGMNVYEYAASRPTAFVDPTGRIIVGIVGNAQPRSTMQPLVSAIQQRVNARMKVHGFEETCTKVFGGGFFGHTAETKQLIRDWGRRKEKAWHTYRRDCGEQMVIVGHSDGATAIWQISQDGAHKVRGSNPQGFWNVAYLGMIDMVRPNFGFALPNTQKDTFIQPGQARWPTKLDNYFQDTGRFLRWLGYKVGWRPNHLVPDEDHLSVVRNQAMIDTIADRATARYDLLYHLHNGDFRY